MRANCRRCPLCARTTRAPAKLEGVQVRVGDDRLVGVGDPANVGDQTRRRELGREEAQVAVERRQGRRAVGERILGPQRRRVPRLHAEAREVEERVHHPRAVRLPDEAVVGVEQQIPHGERLTEVGQDPAHAPIVLAPTRAASAAAIGRLGLAAPDGQEVDEAIQVRRRGAGLPVGDAQRRTRRSCSQEIHSHARDAHGMDEVPPEVVDAIHGVITEV